MKTGKIGAGFLFLLIVAGIALMAFPFASNHLHRWEQSKKIYTYSQTVDLFDGDAKDNEMKAVENYNTGLLNHPFSTELPDPEKSVYEMLLDPLGDGVMGYLDIPSINVSAPIYHGVSDGVLAAGIGHIPGSTLPAGGEGTHTLLSGHTGLSSAKLFTDLVQVGNVDEFIITVLNRRLTYRVDEINVVEPGDVRLLRPVEGKDLCTLITCTPYGVNSHRLLVRGRRVPNHEPEGVEAEVSVNKKWMLSAITFALLAGLMIVGLVRRKRSQE